MLEVKKGFGGLKNLLVWPGLEPQTPSMEDKSIFLEVYGLKWGPPNFMFDLKSSKIQFRKLNLSLRNLSG